MKKILFMLFLALACVAMLSSENKGQTEWSSLSNLQNNYENSNFHFSSFEERFFEPKSDVSEFAVFSNGFSDASDYEDFIRSLRQSEDFDEFLIEFENQDRELPDSLSWEDKTIVFEYERFNHPVTIVCSGCGGNPPPDPGWYGWNLDWVDIMILNRERLREDLEKSKSYSVSYGYTYRSEEAREIGEYIDAYADMLTYEIISLLHLHDGFGDEEFYPALSMLFFICDISDKDPALKVRLE